ncbi:MAG: hypothetical protein EXR68_06850 [Dehalococcoidia bacterium]|nr:hypothetical protein [Dehalococcoidia bacterium]
MHWNDDAQQAAFRKEASAFIERELPARYHSDQLGPEAWSEDRHSGDPERQGYSLEWVRALAARGWIAPGWKKEYGGGGLTSMEQFILNHELAKHNAPMVGGQEISQIGPAIIIHGSDELKKEHLSRILTGETNWCQGFSEPGAGSDLASLTTRAVRDGDEYVVNGQKIWTSNAHHAEWIALLVRTDPDAPKHRGISFLLVNMKTPGISIRPLVNMAWDHHFNETFFEDVHVPVKNRVGDENRGWYVSVTLMDFERSRIRQAVSARRHFNEITDYLKTEDGEKKSRHHEFNSLRLELADRFIETEIAFNMALRVVSMQARGIVPNYEASILQLSIFETNQRTARSEARLYGLYSNIWSGDWAARGGQAIHNYVSTVSSTIAGGSAEIQRNVIATRGLGLPRG